jgi:hypothetical protein
MNSGDTKHLNLASVSKNFVSSFNCISVNNWFTAEFSIKSNSRFTFEGICLVSYYQLSCSHKDVFGLKMQTWGSFQKCYSTIYLNVIVNRTNWKIKDEILTRWNNNILSSLRNFAIVPWWSIAPIPYVSLNRSWSNCCQARSHTSMTYHN